LNLLAQIVRSRMLWAGHFLVNQVEPTREECRDGVMAVRLPAIVHFHPKVLVRPSDCCCLIWSESSEFLDAQYGTLLVKIPFLPDMPTGNITTV